MKLQVVFSPGNLFYKSMQKLYMWNIFTVEYLDYTGDD